MQVQAPAAIHHMSLKKDFFSSKFIWQESNFLVEESKKNLQHSDEVNGQHRNSE